MRCLTRDDRRNVFGQSLSACCAWRTHVAANQVGNSSAISLGPNTRTFFHGKRRVDKIISARYSCSESEEYQPQERARRPLAYQQLSLMAERIPVDTASLPSNAGAILSLGCGFRLKTLGIPWRLQYQSQPSRGASGTKHTVMDDFCLQGNVCASNQDSAITIISDPRLDAESEYGKTKVGVHLGHVFNY